MLRLHCSSRKIERKLMLTVVLLKIHAAKLKYFPDINKNYMVVFLLNSRARKSLVVSSNSPPLSRTAVVKLRSRPPSSGPKKFVPKSYINSVMCN